jgi:RNA polymerase-binding transcription factor
MDKSRMDFYQDVLMRKLKELHSTIEGKRVERIKDFDEPEPDMYDLCVQSYSEEQLFSLCKRDHEVLVSVWEAIEKIKRKAYGICEECEKPIEEKRLQALPRVKRCIVCQSRKENDVAA